MWPRGFQEVKAPRSHDVQHMKLVRSSAPRTCRLYPQEMFLVPIFTGVWVDPSATVRSEGNMSLKNPVAPPGIDPGTVRLVVQRLNHYATPGPKQNWWYIATVVCLQKCLRTPALSHASCLHNILSFNRTSVFIWRIWANQARSPCAESCKH
jgi:hypothetical protein